MQMPKCLNKLNAERDILTDLWSTSIERWQFWSGKPEKSPTITCLWILTDLRLI